MLQWDVSGSKRKGEWKAAVDNLDTYVMLYDSIQGISDNEELVRLMDNYQLEEYKRKLSEHTRTLIMSLVVVFISLMIICLFLFCGMTGSEKNTI